MSVTVGVRTVINALSDWMKNGEKVGSFKATYKNCLAATKLERPEERRIDRKRGPMEDACVHAGNRTRGGNSKNRRKKKNGAVEIDCM